MRRGALLAVALAALPACAPAPLVERGYGARVIEGHAIEPEAYAAFLEGAMIEAAGDERGALAAFDRAARLDGLSPEIWTRIGAARCALDPRNPYTGDAFGRALALDATYAGLYAAKARCAAARNDPAAERDAADRAAALDPSADGARALLARAGSAVRDPTTRDALVALTETARDRVAAWTAAAAWASSHGDVPLWALALETTVKIAPARRDAVASAAEDLAGAGQMTFARAVAAAAADAGDAPLTSAHPLAARLALDEALARGEAGPVRLRATRVRVSLEEAAARAWIAGQRDLARDLVTPVVRTDAGALGARMVLAACDGNVATVAAELRRAGAGADASIGAGAGARASGAAVVVFGMAMGRGTSARELRSLLDAAHATIVAGDDRVVRRAVELVSRGALDPAALPPDGIVELAVLRGPASGEGASLPGARSLDERHEYLALAVTDPKGTATRDLGARLGPIAAGDPIVAAAAALAQVGSGAPIDAGAASRLLNLDPADPLLAAVALQVATRTGDADAATKARATLTALGGSSGGSAY
ncbi:MAG TPA: hypothetical protein VHV30_16325 [Polyangiaceae bacterium]|jgi:hypothetical protein|nr:hypothetical protein [Polyangiaceae bacterium]